MINMDAHNRDGVKQRTSYQIKNKQVVITHNTENQNCTDTTTHNMGKQSLEAELQVYLFLSRRKHSSLFGSV